MPLPAPADLERFRCELYYVLLDFLTDIEIRRGTLEGMSYAEDCFKLLHALRFRHDLVEIVFETLAETGTDFGRLRTPKELRFVDEFLEILCALID